jgi:hypothetical protein
MLLWWRSLYWSSSSAAMPVPPQPGRGSAYASVGLFSEQICGLVGRATMADPLSGGGVFIPHAGTGEPFAWWVRPAANGVRPAGFTPYMPWRTVPAEPLVPRSMPLVADRELVFLGVHLGDPLRPLEQLRAV